MGTEETACVTTARLWETANGIKAVLASTEPVREGRYP
ncbi:hypothetical protein NRB56_20550 [Nocardia sp. RB56]|uniref:Uncharacterized protein n=1 Tax=Nocardia aurantia TaxID=2585199 RepID=A0A7K0DL30_9NOCA|nr:hypothetical protein [Nocardia aurantia]